MANRNNRRKDSSSDDNESDRGSQDSNDRNIEEFNWKELPPHACSYCGIHDPNSVVKCNAKNCNKWFCNHKGEKSGNASHIAIHLVKAKHNEVAIHPDSDIGSIDVECYRCGNANVFVLGYVKMQEGEDDVVLFLCRMPCVEEKSFGDLNWDPKNWNPLIQNKQFVNIFFQKPPEDMIRKMRNLEIEEILKLEELWKTNAGAKFEDLSKKKPERRLRPLLMKYKDGDQYRRIFDSLLAEEAKSDKKIKESQTQNNLTLRFEEVSKNKYNAYFVFASK